jgi:hypothetical protein
MALTAFALPDLLDTDFQHGEPVYTLSKHFGGDCSCGLVCTTEPLVYFFRHLLTFGKRDAAKQRLEHPGAI